MAYVSPWPGVGFKSMRRVYLASARHFAQSDQHATADVYRAKQQAIAGDPLPENFPHLARLAELGYSTFQDIDGANADELTAAGLPRHQANEALARLAYILA